MNLTTGCTSYNKENTVISDETTAQHHLHRMFGCVAFMLKTSTRNWVRKTLAVSNTHHQHHMYTADNSHYTNSSFRRHLQWYQW